MGSIMKARAGVKRIVQYGMATMTAAAARGGSIEAAAKDRLGPGLAKVKQAQDDRDATAAAEEAAFQAVKVGQEKADGTIGAIKDEMWNRIGRPRQSDFIDQVFPDGIGTYTDGDVRDRPIKMKILMARLSSAPVAAWDAGRADWVKRLDDARASLAAAVEALRTATAESEVADSTYRSVARSLLVGLHNFKRDLLTMGLTEQKVHDIIPDATPAAPARATGGTTPPAPSTSPEKPSGNDNQTPPAPPTHAAG